MCRCQVSNLICFFFFFITDFCDHICTAHTSRILIPIHYGPLFDSTIVCNFHKWFFFHSMMRRKKKKIVKKNHKKQFHLLSQSDFHNHNLRISKYWARHTTKPNTLFSHVQRTHRTAQQKVMRKEQWLLFRNNIFALIFL